MAKKGKNLNKVDNQAYKIFENHMSLVNRMFAEFYPDGMVADFSFPAFENEYFDSYYDSEEHRLSMMAYEETVEYLKDKWQRCNEVRRNIEQRKSGNVEICFDKGVIRSWNGEYSLGNSIIKLQEYIDDHYPSYIFLKKGDRCDVRILMGNTHSGKEIFLIDMGEKQRKDGSSIVSVSSCCMFGLCNSTESGEKKMIMAGCLYDMREAVSLLFNDIWLGEVRHLLQVDWLQRDWAMAKYEAERRQSGGEQKSRRPYAVYKPLDVKNILERELDFRKVFIGNKPVVVSKTWKKYITVL